MTHIEVPRKKAEPNIKSFIIIIIIIAVFVVVYVAVEVGK
jgi:hypothetical protein